MYQIDGFNVGYQTADRGLDVRHPWTAKTECVGSMMRAIEVEFYLRHGVERDKDCIACCGSNTMGRLSCLDFATICVVLGHHGERRLT